MGSGQRIVFGLLGLSVIVAAFVFISGRESEGPNETTTTAAQVETTIQTASTPAPASKTTPKPVEALTVLTADKPRTIKVISGDTVKFKALLKDGGTVHVHGYDLEFEAKPGKAVTITFPAKLEGKFEIEDHHTDALLGTLQVEPR